MISFFQHYKSTFNSFKFIERCCQEEESIHSHSIIAQFKRGKGPFGVQMLQHECKLACSVLLTIVIKVANPAKFESKPPPLQKKTTQKKNKTKPIHQNAKQDCVSCKKLSKPFQSICNHLSYAQKPYFPTRTQRKIRREPTLQAAITTCYFENMTFDLGAKPKFICST